MSRSEGGGKRTAVALKYDEYRNVAPVVVATGVGYMAEKIIEVANEHSVPVFEDSSLSTILSQLDLGAEVPEELYKVVVDIYVYFLNYLPKDKRP